MDSANVAGSQGVQIGDHNVQANMYLDSAALLPQPESVTVPPGTHNLPSASTVFVGRDLAELDGLLERGRGVVGQAVHGLGGIGKTELALHYAHRSRKRYSLVWWITADSPERLSSGLAALTAFLCPASRLIQADAGVWALRWLQAQSSWLVVLDNVEELQHISDFLGQVGVCGTVLVTTRRDVGKSRWARLGLSPLRLGVLDRPMSVDLLVKLTGLNDLRGAERLAEVLGDLPLALEQATAFICQHEGLTFDGYRELLASRFGRLAGNPGEGGDAQRTVGQVWAVTIAVIGQRSTEAVRVLEVLAYLAPDGLPQDVLTPLAEDPLDTADALALLASYSMITCVGGVISVHRLLQAVIRESVARVDDAAVDVPTALCEAVRLLRLAAPNGDPLREAAGWPRWGDLAPHVVAVFAHFPADRLNVEVLDLVGRAATYMESQGYCQQAIDLFRKVVAGSRRVLGDDDPRTLASRNNLAGAYRYAGRVGEAVSLFEQVAEDFRRVLGGDDPETLVACNNLAGAYRSVGRLAEAIRLCERVLTDRRRVLGDSHPGTMASRHNLAYILSVAGRGTDAVDQYERLLVDRQRVLGDDHRDTLATRHNLASNYKAVGRLVEAARLFEHVLADRRRVLGESNPDVLETQDGLAGVYESMGRFGESISLYEQTVAKSTQVLGRNHPRTLSSRNNCAHAYQMIGRVDEAVAMYEQAFADAREALGSGHPITKDIADNLRILSRSDVGL